MKSKIFDVKKKRERFFIEENRNQSCRIVHESDSEKYELVVDSCTTSKRWWNYTCGMVVDKATREVIADIKRNYNDFPFSWAEDHPNGHSYLICGENYQGQTVIELDTKIRKDYLPIDAHNGCGFCWAEHHPSPDMKRLAVIGCYWGGSYDLVIYDFSDPMNLPYKYLAGIDAPDKFHWIDNETAEVEHEKIVRKSDGKHLYDLSEEEQEIAYKNHDENYIMVKEKIKI